MKCDKYAKKGAYTFSRHGTVRPSWFQSFVSLPSCERKCVQGLEQITRGKERQGVSVRSSLEGRPTAHPRLPRGRKATHHFLFGAEEGMALERLVALALSDVGKHFIVHLISSAVGDPAQRGTKYPS